MAIRAYFPSYANRDIFRRGSFLNKVKGAKERYDPELNFLPSTFPKKSDADDFQRNHWSAWEMAV